MGALGNTPRSETVLTLEARRSYAFGLNFRLADDGGPVDLTGCTVKLVLAQPAHKGGTVLLTETATIYDAPLGLSRVELQAADLALAEDEYPFTVTLTSANGYSTTVLKGVVAISANADPAATNVYAGTNPSTQLEVALHGGDVVTVSVDQLDGMSVIVQGLVTNFTAAMDARVADAQAQATTAAGHANRADSAADRAEQIAAGDLDLSVANKISTPGTQSHTSVTTRIQNTAPAAHNHPAAEVTGLAQVATTGDAAHLTGLLNTAQLPPLAVTDTFTVADQAAMLALTAQRGDLAIRQDNGRTYVLSSNSPGTLADWKEVMAAGQVQSVNGKTGVVTLSPSDVSAAPAVHSHAAPALDDLSDVSVAAPAHGDRMIYVAGSGWVRERRAVVRCRHTLGSNIPSGTTTSPIWDTEDEDDLGFHAANDSRLIVPSGFAGLYLITVRIVFPYNATGSRGATIMKNLSTTIAESMRPAPPNGWTTVTTLAYLLSGDIIQGGAYQDSGAQMALAPNDTYINMVRLTL